MAVQVRLATERDIEVVLKVLNKATTHLINKGINQWEYPWVASIIKADILEENVYVLEQNQCVIGTFSIKKVEKKYPIKDPNGNYLYRIALLPNLQGKSIGKVVINYVKKIALSNTIYLDCYYGNNKLRNFYMNCGLLYIGDYPEHDYYISVYKITPINNG
ncbi:GNAT family N-acetyltransferase [Haloplasma contractile]|uniref:N-acetyltransferase GCN5 protein n=1 Tax=Haloplasma contractile SSD-17B TaxID=1033810 RepID=F7Q215_9MOLU|nr:GNAT family N-acetyltransferase [Haloplasma contractile]ERJ12177.1 N-acetyltransferase GCN5 protein [Haloplasma contractile SSD-17B]